MKNAAYVLVLAPALSFAACVPKTQFDAKSAEADSCQKELADNKQKVAQLTQQLSDDDKQIGDLKTAAGMAQSQAQGLSDEQKQELEEARRAVSEAQERAKLLDDLQAKFKKMIDAGHLKVTTRHGRIVLELKTDVLFDTGEAEIKAAGKDAINEVAQTLKEVTGKRFQVAGHTDNAPITAKTQKTFPTNWELSAARAISVVKLLTQDGVDPANLSAAGYSLYDPVSANTPGEGQAKNRRIEITLVPNVADLVAPSSGGGSAPAAAAPPAPAPAPAAAAAPEKPEKEKKPEKKKK
jgi:chemotaxis protein MotB